MLFRELVERHFKEVDAEFAIEIMQLVIDFPWAWGSTLQIVLIVGAFRIYDFQMVKNLRF